MIQKGFTLIAGPILFACFIMLFLIPVLAFFLLKGKYLSRKSRRELFSR